MNRPESFPRLPPHPLHLFHLRHVRRHHHHFRPCLFQPHHLPDLFLYPFLLPSPFLRRQQPRPLCLRRQPPPSRNLGQRSLGASIRTCSNSCVHLCPCRKATNCSLDPLPNSAATCSTNRSRPAPNASSLHMSTLRHDTFAYSCRITLHGPFTVAFSALNSSSPVTCCMSLLTTHSSISSVVS